jgi:uncharacterized protein (DUF362 family)
MKNGLKVSEQMSLVSLVKTKNDAFEEAILSALSLIDYKFKQNIKNVVIKPNMCYYWDSSTGQTTDPKLIGALISVLRKELSSQIDISIVESDASAMKCNHAFRFLGYEKLAHDCKVKLVNLSEDEYETVKISSNGASMILRIPAIIRRADLRINVPKIKYMDRSGLKITCALKNIYGCNPYPKKFKYHSTLCETIIALNKAMRFDLVLIDGNVVFGNKTKRLGLLMASNDPVAIDAAASKIAGIDPRTIKYLKLASKEGLGNVSYVQKGVPLSYFAERYPCKDAFSKLMHLGYETVLLLKLGKKLGLE